MKIILAVVLILMMLTAYGLACIYVKAWLEYRRGMGKGPWLWK